jgi:hypothetical protein
VKTDRSGANGLAQSVTKLSRFSYRVDIVNNPIPQKRHALRKTKAKNFGGSGAKSHMH